MVRLWIIIVKLNENKNSPDTGEVFVFERVGRIELPDRLWKSRVLPLYDTRLRPATRDFGGQAR